MKANLNLSNKSLFYHNCKKCCFLGTFDGNDLYFCSYGNMGIPTVIARYGEDPRDYWSGMAFGKMTLTEKHAIVPLRVAFLIAKDLGLIE